MSMENQEACIENQLWRRTDDSEVALTELRGRLTTLRQQLDLILRAELGLPEADTMCNTIGLLAGEGEGQKIQLPSVRTLLEQQAEALLPTQRENDENDEQVVPASPTVSMPSSPQRLSSGGALLSDVGHDGLINIIHSKLRQDFDNRLEKVDARMKWLSQSVMDLRTDMSASQAVNKEVNDSHLERVQTVNGQSVNSPANGSRDLSILNLHIETCPSPGKDDVRELRCNGMQAPNGRNLENSMRPSMSAEKSYDSAQLLEHMEKKHSELLALIQAELTQKVDQVSAYQDALRKQQDDKLTHLHACVDEVRSVVDSFGNSVIAEHDDRKAHLVQTTEGNYQACRRLCEGMILEAEGSRTASLQDFRTEIIAQCRELCKNAREEVPQDFRTEIIARCQDVCKNTGDEVLRSMNGSLQAARTQMETSIATQIASEMYSFHQKVNADRATKETFTKLSGEVERLWAFLHEHVPEVSEKLGDTTLMQDRNLGAMAKSAESITQMAGTSNCVDSKTEAECSITDQAVTKARSQSFFNLVVKSSGRSLTTGMFEDVVGTWTYESSAGKKTFTISRNATGDLVFRQPIICEIEGCSFEGILFPKEIDDVKWACGRVRDGKDNLLAGTIKLRYDAKAGGLSILFHGLLGADVKTIALPRVQTRALPQTKALPQTNLGLPLAEIHQPPDDNDVSIDELFDLRKVRACKMFNLVSKALEIQEPTSRSGSRSGSQSVKFVETVEPDRLPSSIPEVGDSGADETIKGDSCTNSDLQNFINDDNLCEVKEISRKMFNLVSKCMEEDARAQAKKARTAMRRKYFADFVYQNLPCSFCCITSSTSQEANMGQSIEEARSLDDECDRQLQNSGRPQQADTLSTETSLPAVGIDGVDTTTHVRLNRTMFSLVSKALSVEGRDKVQNSADERRLQKERKLLTSFFGQPSCNPSSRSLSSVPKNNEVPQPNPDHNWRMLRVVQKAIGSDLCDDNPVKPKIAPNVETRDFSEVMSSEDFLVLRQKSEQMLTIVVKAREGFCEKRAISTKAPEQPNDAPPDDAPPEVTDVRFTADVSRWWMMCVTFCSGSQEGVSRETSQQDVVELVELADEASARNAGDNGML